MHIGTEEEPFQHNARVILHGNIGSKTLVISNDIKTSNKAFANIGLVKMFGKKRSGYLTRLKQEVFKGMTEFLVEPWIDIEVGDEIALAT